MISKIPYGRQDISQYDIDAVVDVLNSNWLTQGPVVPRFEQAVANYCQAPFSIAVNSATSALHIACHALGLGLGDWLWTSPITFVASANAALFCGAKIDFVDIDSKTYNLSLDCLTHKLALAEKEGRLPKIVMPVHFAGQSCDMEPIYNLSVKYGFRIIEDASHAIGGFYQGNPIGCCKYSDIVVFSFHPVKIITTGEGGIAVTKDSLLAEKMRRLRTHGITTSPDFMRRQPETEIWNYQQIEIGFNFRMTDIQAALGESQLRRVDEFVSRRHEVALRYNSELSKLPITLPWQDPKARSSYHLYPIRIPLQGSGLTQRGVYDSLHREGIGANLHYIPVYRQPFYQDMGFQIGYCPEAEKYFKEAISLPMYSALKNEQQGRVIQILNTLFN